MFFREVPDFSVHILPRGEISSDATAIHGIEKKSGKLFLRGNPIPAVDLYQALDQFQNWILKNFYENSAVLVIAILLLATFISFLLKSLVACSWYIYPV
jgi:hypothetical protein